MNIRVRFAPSPTGLMHLGNVRAALMNYLFARQHNGTFILRIEDTDPERNFDPGAQKIQADLVWLGLSFDEGPQINGSHAPYFQSERTHIHQDHLQKLIDLGYAYRCFCTQEDLEKKRMRQIALKQPPRYDRSCLKKNSEEITELLAQNIPFIWRVKLNHESIIQVQDLAHGTITFDLKNFSDFPVTRQDGSFTFMFANAIDDMTMKITHVFRGEDHQTNTAGQAALYEYFNAPLPTYWHMPILCNNEGKKLSKRDFGFSLHDLQKAGYLPETINNYLSIIGGGTFEKEIMSLDELVQSYDFKHINATGHIRYDIEKLNWVNHKWIELLDPAKLTTLAKPFLIAAYPHAATLSDDTLTTLIQTIKTDITTLKDIAQTLQFYFEPSHNHASLIQTHFSDTTHTALKTLVQEKMKYISDASQFLSMLKDKAKQEKIGYKDLFAFLRIALMGSIQGPSILDLLTMLGAEESRKRIESVLQ